jgi:2-hydroxyglutarate dehydrogenase
MTHQIIGGGAVGLAIARQLAARDGTSSVLIERNGAVGMETSSRNSEVSSNPKTAIHVLNYAIR